MFIVGGGFMCIGSDWVEICVGRCLARFWDIVPGTNRADCARNKLKM